MCSKSVKCRICDKKIPKARLIAVPDTDLCVKCAAKRELVEGFTVNIPLDEYDCSELQDAIGSDD